jgi:hypothetical protein
MNANEFPAEVFAADLPGGRASGTLEVLPDRLVARAPAMVMEMPLAGLAVRVSGVHQEVLLFTHPARPGAAISVVSTELARHPALLAHAPLAAALEGVRAERRRGRLVLPGCCGCLVLLGIMAIAIWAPLIRWLADRVPASVESQVGDLLFSGIAAGTPMLEDAELESHLDALVAPLLAVVPNPGYHFDFHLADDPTLNAYALPGGNVVVHSGLLLAAERPEEVLGVLGHEIAHVTERHSLRQLIGQAGVGMVFQALLGDFSGLAGIAATSGQELLGLKFSRDQEREADAVGWAYLEQAGIDPRGMLAFFDRVEQEQAKSGAARSDAALNFLSTHPVTAERRLALEQRSSADAAFVPSDFDLGSFQAMIKAKSKTTPDAPGASP